MFLEPEELSALLREEDQYIAELKNRWQKNELPQDTEQKLRIGKRVELLGNLQYKKELIGASYFGHWFPRESRSPS